MMKMKGISSVVAIILILMIVVSLAALAYVWFMTVFTSLTGAAGEAATGAERAIGTSFKIEAAKNITVDMIKVSMRNIGTVEIDMSKIAVYLDGIQQDSANLEGDAGTLAVDDVKSFNITNVANPCDRVLQVTVPAGASDATTTVC
jgi:flagellin-like protein